MRKLLFALLAAIGLALVLVPAAEAGSRITCQCKTGTKTWIMGTYACEYHMKKRFRASAGSRSKPVTSCTSREHTAFRSMLCAQECPKT